MTDYLTTWDKILHSLSGDDKFDPVCRVNVYELTEHLDTLYTKIADPFVDKNKEELKKLYKHLENIQAMKTSYLSGR